MHTGIWTDGSWAFSTGLDQRLRCWHLSSIWSEPPSQSTNGLENHPENVSSQFTPMAERNQCVIDVPEAEDLHVESDSIGWVFIRFQERCDNLTVDPCMHFISSATNTCGGNVSISLWNFIVVFAS